MSTGMVANRFFESPELGVDIALDIATVLKFRYTEDPRLGSAVLLACCNIRGVPRRPWLPDPGRGLHEATRAAPPVRW